MSPPLFLVADLPELGAPFRLGGRDGHHAADVQRLRPGEPALLGDGRGGLAAAVVVVAGRGWLDLDVLELTREPAPEPRLVVVQGVPKGERAELAVQAMTEIGVDEIVPWTATRCVVRWHGDRGQRSVARWRTTARESTKQSRRRWLPEVSEPTSTQRLADRLRQGRARGLVLHEEAKDRLVAADLPETGEVVVVVGPEGGIAPEEVALLESAGATPVRLGSTVLRTSTAGPAALAVLCARLGRW